MARYLVKQLPAALVTLLILSVVSFVIIRMLPGNAAQIRLAGSATSLVEIRQAEHRLKLDRPVYERYAAWLGDVLRGNWGRSLSTDSPVLSELRQRLPVTAQLTLVATLFSLVFGIGIGALSIASPFKLVRSGAELLPIFGLAVPSYVFALLGIIVFAVKLRWVPVSGYVRPGTDAGAWAKHMILPAASLALVFGSALARQVRANVLDVLHEDYVRTARAKGLSSQRILWRHVLRNAAVPVLTVLVFHITVLLGGAVITEAIFGIPGIGQWSVQAMSTRDFPVIQAVVIVMALLVVLINLATEVAYTWVDPRFSVVAEKGGSRA